MSGSPLLVFIRIGLPRAGSLAQCSASKYTDFPVILRNSNTIYGQKSKNTEEKRTREGVASITTSWGFKRATEKLRKIRKICYYYYYYTHQIQVQNDRKRRERWLQITGEANFKCSVVIPDASDLCDFNWEIAEETSTSEIVTEERSDSLSDDLIEARSELRREEECLFSRELNLEANMLAIFLVPLTPSTTGECLVAPLLLSPLMSDQKEAFFFIANKCASQGLALDQSMDTHLDVVEEGGSEIREQLICSMKHSGR